MVQSLTVLLLLVLTTVPALAKTKYQPLPVRLDHGGEKWAKKTLAKMSLEEKVGQVFMVWCRAEFLNVNSPEYLELHETINKYGVGAFAMTVSFVPPFSYKCPPYQSAAPPGRREEAYNWCGPAPGDFPRSTTPT